MRFVEKTLLYIIKLSIFLPCSMKMMDQSVHSSSITALRWHFKSWKRRRYSTRFFSLMNIYNLMIQKALFSVKSISLNCFGGTSSQISGRMRHYILHRHQVLISLRHLREYYVSSSSHLHWFSMFLISTIANHNVEVSFKKISKIKVKICFETENLTQLSQFSQII